MRRTPRKSDSHRNRGQSWEQMLEAWHDLYARRGTAHVTRTPPSVRPIGAFEGGQFRAVYTGKGPPDYMGAVAVPGRLAVPVVFDAKEELSGQPKAGLKFAFSKIPDHQATDMDRFTAVGALTFVAVNVPWRQYVVWWAGLSPYWWRWREEGGRPASLPLAKLMPTEGNLDRCSMVDLQEGLPGVRVDRMRRDGWLAVVQDVIASHE